MIVIFGVWMKHLLTYSPKQNKSKKPSSTETNKQTNKAQRFFSPPTLLLLLENFLLDSAFFGAKLKPKVETLSFGNPSSEISADRCLRCCCSVEYVIRIFSMILWYFKDGEHDWFMRKRWVERIAIVLKKQLTFFFSVILMSWKKI